MLLPDPVNSISYRKYAINYKVNISLAIITCIMLWSNMSMAQGTWKQVATTSPDLNAGVMLLLTNGTVMVKTKTGFDGSGNYWNKLIPDVNGSYVNGIWSSMAPMTYSRFYFSTQVLRNGNVYVAGGEYGNGKAKCEIYDPLADSWSPGPNTLIPSDSFFDANSEILPDGKILQAIVIGGSLRNYIYDPVANTYTLGPNSLKNHDESTWVKLPDSSILYVDIDDTTSERYIPSLNRWIKDDTLHVRLYDTFGKESGAGFLLPDRRVFFIGSTGKTAFYTPSGDTTHGTWTTGPDIPDSLGAPDAAAAMMPNGKILCAFSHVPTDSIEFHKPTYFYEFDYLTDSFTKIHAPIGGDTMSCPSYYTNMLNLPDGSILFSTQYSSKYYVYTPSGKPLAAGKPTIDAITKIDCYTYMATGKNFNGISEGSCYGDDWQMATNYPIIRLTDDESSVSYARTYNWNCTGVMTGNLPDTTTFSIDPALPEGTYSLQVIVNGNPSDNFAFSTCSAGIPVITTSQSKGLYTYPNPATNEANLVFNSVNGGKYSLRLIDVLGRVMREETINAATGKNTHNIYINELTKGIYTVMLGNENEILKTKIVVE